MAAGQGMGQVPVRGTQSLVHTLSRCWRRPSLTGLEVLWRWVFGVPALWVVFVQVRRVLLLHTGGTLDMARLGLDRKLMADPVGSLAGDPLGVSAKVSDAVGLVLPDLLHAALWVVPVLLVVWVVVSSVGTRVTGDHVIPSSFEVLTGTRFGGPPLSRMYATSVPSRFRTIDGCTFPAPTNGSLVLHEAPLSSEIAISENE